jgi:hypothetical protein
MAMNENVDSSAKETNQRQRQLAALASRKRVPLLREIIRFLRHNKKWWLAPLIVMLLLVGALLALGGTAVAPFIYTLF